MMKSRITAALILVSLLVLSASCSCNISKAAVLKVAASDSSGKIRAQADYVCDGKDDQKEIQTAIDSLSDLGGVVEILPGNYYKSSSEPIYLPSNIVLRMNSATINQADVPDATQEMVFANADNVGGNNNIEIVGGKITGTIVYALYFDNVSRITVKDMDLTADTTAIKILNSNYINIQDNYVHDGEHGFYISSSNHGIIDNNRFYNMNWGAGEISTVAPGGGCKYFTVSNNIVEESNKTGIEIVHSSYVTCVGNVIKNKPAALYGIIIIADAANPTAAMHNTISANSVTGGKVGIYSLYGNRNIIIGNSVSNTSNQGIYALYSSELVIANNNLFEIGGQGIELATSTDSVIEGNFISDASKGTHNRHNGIAVTGTRCSIVNNIIRQGETADAWAGIRIRSDSQGCIVRGNDLRDSGTTYQLYDEGTGTIALLNVVD
jgi:parallel beta-helix repeat protein